MPEDINAKLNEGGEDNYKNRKISKRSVLHGVKSTHTALTTTQTSREFRIMAKHSLTQSCASQNEIEELSYLIHKMKSLLGIIF